MVLFKTLYGYYFEALVIFGDLTGLDPRSLDGAEQAAGDLGFSQKQAIALRLSVLRNGTWQVPLRLQRARRSPPVTG